MLEIYKDICQVYSVSNMGNIKNKITNKVMKQKKNQNGYMTIQLSYSHNRKFFMVHRLVGKAFLDNYLNKPEINHIDNNRCNNVADNLEWVTKSENAIHRIKTGNVMDINGDKNPMAKISKEIAIEIKYNYKDLKHSEIAKIYNLPSNLVGRIRRGECWKCI